MEKGKKERKKNNPRNGRKTDNNHRAMEKKILNLSQRNKVGHK